MSGMIESEENSVYKNRKNGAVTLMCTIVILKNKDDVRRF